jgi:hypothetical protein
MRIDASPHVSSCESVDGTGMPNRERIRMCEVPSPTRSSSHSGLADAITPVQIFSCMCCCMIVAQ